MKPDSIFPHWKDLPKGKVNVLTASTVAANLTGCIWLTQNSKGLVTIFWQGGSKEPVQMGDFNLAAEEDFYQAFRKVWARKELGT